jgi:BlaI family penicillinase repressor
LIIGLFPSPQPPYNTISSVVRILEKKGFISHKVYGHTHEYFPIINRDAYKKFYLKDAVKNYFEDSFQQMVSFFAKEDELKVEELEQLIDMIKKHESDKNG